MCAYLYFVTDLTMNFICLPVSFFSFKSTLSASLFLPYLHLCKNHKTLDLRERIIPYFPNYHINFKNSFRVIWWSDFMYGIGNKHVIALFHSCVSICTLPVSRPYLHLWDADKVDTLWCYCMKSFLGNSFSNKF